MKNLFIRRLKYYVTCEDGSKYGADIPFNLDKKINIIFGPNSVGKSSVLIGIIYGLGAEKSLGIFQLSQNPFKPEFHKEIDGKKVNESYLILEISNGKKTVCIKRDILGDIGVVLIKECDADHMDSTTDFVKLIAEGKGVMEDNGFQNYLFNFLGWNIVEVPKFEGGVSKLYFENLVPLFFVEQRAGWSEIQARQIQRYGIRDIKKVAFEYLMGLNKFDVHILELQRKELLEKIEVTESDLKNKENEILIEGNATIQSDGNIFVEMLNYGRLPIKDLIRKLKEDLEEKQKLLSRLHERKNQVETFENKERDKLRQVSHSKAVTNDKITAFFKEIAGYKGYIEKIELNKKKNLQLKRIDKVCDNFNISFCPICQSEINNSDEGTCKLCKSEIRKVSSPDENICFLEDEKASFEKIIVIKQIELEKAKKQYENLIEEERILKEKIDFQLKTYYGKALNRLREIIFEAESIDNIVIKYERLLNRWIGLDKIRNELKNLYEKEKRLKENIENYKESADDKKLLSKILENFQKNISKLRLFKAREDLIKELKLDDKDNYTPYLVEYDLYNVISSSDNIRTFIGYYLSLLQTSLDLNWNKIRFPGLLIFDEPKQQNLDPIDIKTCVEIMESMSKEKPWQVILTTHNENKDIFKDYIIFEMKDSKDFLLKKIS